MTRYGPSMTARVRTRRSRRCPGGVLADVEGSSGEVSDAGGARLQRLWAPRREGEGLEGVSPPRTCASTAPSAPRSACSNPRDALPLDLQHARAGARGGAVPGAHGSRRVEAQACAMLAEELAADMDEATVEKRGRTHSSGTSLRSTGSAAGLSDLPCLPYSLHGMVDERGVRPQVGLDRLLGCRVQRHQCRIRGAARHRHRSCPRGRPTCRELWADGATMPAAPRSSTPS